MRAFVTTIALALLAIFSQPAFAQAPAPPADCPAFLAGMQGQGDPIRGWLTRAVNERENSWQAAGEAFAANMLRDERKAGVCTAAEISSAAMLTAGVDASTPLPAAAQQRIAAQQPAPPPPQPAPPEPKAEEPPARSAQPANTEARPAPPPVRERVVMQTVDRPVTDPALAARQRELQDGQVRLLAAQRQLQAVQRQQATRIAELTARPTLTPAERAELARLVEAGRAVMAQLATIDGQLGQLAERLTKVEGDIASLKTSDASQNTKIDALETQSKAGNQLVYWALGLSVFGILLGILLGILHFFRKAGAKVTKQAIDGLVAEVDSLSTDVADAAKVQKRVVMPTDLAEVLDALSKDEAFDVVLEVDGQKGIITFTKVGNDQVTTGDIASQTQAIKIANVRSTLLRAIGAGRVKLRPMPQLTVAAAA